MASTHRDTIKLAEISTASTRSREKAKVSFAYQGEHTERKTKRRGKISQRSNISRARPFAPRLQFLPPCSIPRRRHPFSCIIRALSGRGFYDRCSRLLFNVAGWQFWLACFNARSRAFSATARPRLTYLADVIEICRVNFAVVWFCIRNIEIEFVKSKSCLLTRSCIISFSESGSTIVGSGTPIE